MKNINKWSLAVLSAAILIWSGVGVEFSFRDFFDFGKTIDFFQKQWWPPDFSNTNYVIKASVITLQIAIVGTFLGLLFALPLSFLGAWNTAPAKWVYNSTRGVLNFFRSVPEIVFGLLLVPTFGLGPFPAVLAIALHNIGVLGKLISELIEAAEDGPQEAVRSVGAKRIIVIIYGILPQIIPNIISNFFYRLEVGIRASLILGFIGGGGIGSMLFIDFKIANYQMVATEVLFIMLLVMMVDYIGALIRKRVI
ncbi:phosphonate ABC transporter, permease protein PhnE [Bacillus sp. DJP31]|uniref:phosphonate ABC transporter, permease protein PhnE n=1 Tax=Bacillus sp. DJP31 TaxID=3409789 RepID=UPI003BB495F1